jgi:hypothetical protein
MANQDPQPEIYTTSHTFAGAATSGTSNQVSIFTNQANNEEVRLYAIGIEMLDATTGAALTADLDYDVALQVGPNNVPSNAFSAGFVNSKNDKTLAFSTPVLVLFQQPLSVVVTTNQTVAANGSIIKVTLIGELAIQKIAAHSGMVGYPVNDMVPQMRRR